MISRKSPDFCALHIVREEKTVFLSKISTTLLHSLTITPHLQFSGETGPHQELRGGGYLL